MLKTFIERPVLSTVISVIIVVLGIIGLATLPIEQYPDIAPPTVQVQANYPGANAEVVMNSVVIPLEEQINGVEGMTYMTSSASNGQATLRIFFKQGVNPDIAAVNVQNLAARATPLLPQEVTQLGVIVSKQQNSTLLGLTISTDNPDYDGEFLQNYANINILPQIKRVFGVGNASVFGARDYSMRIWLKPDVMSAYKISVSEVSAALADQNIESAPGELGQNSDQSFQYTMRYTGKLKSEEDFGNIILRSQDGQILRLKDIAKVELGSLYYGVVSSTDKNESVFIMINQTAGSNAQEVIKNVKAVLNDAEKSLPSGVKFNFMMDSSEFLDASIEKVIHTLLEAFVLVFIVVFVFLQDLRSTIIPAVAVPVAIIGTFFFLQVFGFSINLLTLFALVLAIGIVVDDAIVVVEAVHAQLDAGQKDPKVATITAMKEIAPAIVSITLVMSAVFIPVSFIGGTTGIFFKQFGLTLAISILISAVNALTLSPALCALFLKSHNEEHRKKGFIQRFYYYFNMMFSSATGKYKKSLHFLGKRGHRWITIAIILVSSVILFGLMKIIPTGFVPNEDSGGVFGFVTLPPGSSLERTDSVVSQVVDMAQKIEGVKSVTNITGVNFMAGMNSSYGTLIVKMEEWNNRKLSTNEVSAILKEKTSHIKDATFFFVATPTLQGFGIGAGVEMQLQDRTGGNINKFNDIAQNLIQKLRDDKENVMMVMSNFNTSFPQKEISADLPKIKAAGLTLNAVLGSLQAYVGSSYASTFNLYGKQFRVVMQASPEYRRKLEDLNGLYVKTASGEMAPVTEFIQVKDVDAPPTLSRFNMYSSIDVTIIPNFYAGKSTGDVLQLIENMSQDKTIFPDGYSYEYGGMTR
jgi:HAE1 family hydrophobic/amphiphilic exporter-1